MHHNPDFPLKIDYDPYGFGHKTKKEVLERKKCLKITLICAFINLKCQKMKVRIKCVSDETKMKL